MVYSGASVEIDSPHPYANSYVLFGNVSCPLGMLAKRCSNCSEISLAQATVASRRVFTLAMKAPKEVLRDVGAIVVSTEHYRPPVKLLDEVGILLDTRCVPVADMPP